jgi:two-component system LytT family response regulator
MLKALLVDDEIASIKSLEILLGKFCPQVEIVGTSRSVEEALIMTAKFKPELVFLDIEMPSGTGFDFLEQCNSCNFEIVFITAHDNYAVKAFKYSAIDYILKPIEIDELIKAVEKVVEIRKTSFDSRHKYNALFENLKEIIPQKLVVISNGQYTYVDLREVLFFELKDEDLVLRMEDGGFLKIDESLRNIEEQLLDRDFYRIHQNYFVNIQKVRKIIKAGNGSVELVNGMILPLNILKKEELIQLLSERNIHHT